jgi:hypothetical protein
MRTFVVLAATVALTVLAGRAQAGGQTTTETATQFYGRYRSVVAKATNVDEVVALWTADLVQGYRASPPAERVGLDEMNATASPSTRNRFPGRRGLNQGWPP